jgi:hypothetical protein
MLMNLKVGYTVVYALWLAAAGIWRFVDAGSKPALGFGLTTAVMALIGAGLLAKNKTKAAKILLVVTLLFVVGFFVSKASKEGVDLRVGLILASSLLEAVILFLPERKAD